MGSQNMDLFDAINMGKMLTVQQKEIRRQLNEYFDTMHLPEGTDDIKRENVKLWLNNYMNSECSFESLTNILHSWGLSDLLNPTTAYPMKIDKEGHIEIYRMDE